MGNTIGDCLILIVTETITIREVMGTTIHMQFTIERDWQIAIHSITDKTKASSQNSKLIW